MRQAFLSTGVAIMFSAVVFLNAQSAQPAFEVATLKAVPPSPPGQPININLGAVRNGRVTLGNVTLTDCIKFAYGLASDAQVFGPDWIKEGEVRFDIVGQAPSETPRDQLLLMLRALLAERLKLKLHQEKRELPFLALTVAKSGHKLAPAKVDPGESKLGLGYIVHNRMTMAVLATLLSRFERQTVLDLTGLSDFYAITLQWTPDNVRRLAPPNGGTIAINGQSFDANGPSLYTALQEQLGLRLESRKEPVDVVVVDSAERVPLDN